ncbi:metallo proteinase 10 [Coprinopsis marcescibilis]|uniref:Extracellular metalloproteinase n=1 Tax=Coprinopsis marcescibilis TaxID=230819 RepID=A0A5C3KGB2_COPMA|nr:metallo proteinase 10 [Coprinopsis marcescibilis]
MRSTITLNKVFTNLLAAVLLSATLTTVVNAAPWPVYAKHPTHRTRNIGRGVQLEAYYPSTNFKVYRDNGAAVTSGNSLVRGDLKETAMTYISSLGVNRTNLSWRSGFEEGNTGVAYFRQSYDGVPFANAVSNVAFVGDKVASYGTSFIDLTSATIAPSAPSVSWRSVLPQIEESLEASYNNINATLEYFVKPDGQVALTHIIQLQNPETDAWFEAFIDAHSGELISVNDFVAHASYTVVPIIKASFADGLETLTDPQDIEASPLGWHNIGQGQETTTTSGNNALSVRGQELGVATNGEQNFLAAYDDTLAPTDRSNIEASKTNAFYILNVLHDVTYRYGFTERAFNFQQNNFDNGGRARDRVLVSVQDASGKNNANFATPPDGQSGICRMFTWDLTPVERDGALQNDILIHEFAHGVTNRMTGGGNGRCLQTTEAGGMGEGWGDAIADWFAQTSATTRDFTMAGYVTNRAGGLRRFPYSTNAQTNPLRYGDLATLREVHNIGEVWATILHDLYAALVDERGFSDAKLTNPDGTEGNVIWMRLIIDALTLQPCNPTFVQAKEAIVQADQNRYNGDNFCLISRAFATRGLGANARSGRYQNDFSVPEGC